MIDKKGFTDEEIQELIDLKIKMNEFNSLLIQMEVNFTIATIIYNSLKEAQGIKN